MSSYKVSNQLTDVKIRKHWDVSKSSLYFLIHPKTFKNKLGSKALLLNTKIEI